MQEVCVQVVCWHIKSFWKKTKVCGRLNLSWVGFPQPAPAVRKEKTGLCQKLNTKGPIIVSCVLFNARLSLHFSSCCVIRRNDVGHSLYSLSAWTIRIADTICWPGFSRGSLSKTVHASSGVLDFKKRTYTAICHWAAGEWRTDPPSHGGCEGRRLKTATASAFKRGFSVGHSGPVKVNTSTGGANSSNLFVPKWVTVRLNMIANHTLS